MHLSDFSAKTVNTEPFAREMGLIVGGWIRVPFTAVGRRRRSETGNDDDTDAVRTETHTGRNCRHAQRLIARRTDPVL